MDAWCRYQAVGGFFQHAYIHVFYLIQKVKRSNLDVCPGLSSWRGLRDKEKTYDRYRDGSW